MDPISLAIASALSAGAAAGANDAAKRAIVDSYEGLKALLRSKFGKQNDVAEAIEKLERKPTSEGRRQTLAEELRAVGADEESEVLSAARSLLELIKNQPHGDQHIQIACGIGIAQAEGPRASASVVGPYSPKNDE